LLAGPADGRVKMFVASRALAARAAWRDSYERGAYTPIAASGSRAGCMFAFARGAAVTCVPRLIVTLSPDGGAPLGRGVWHDTRIALADAQPLRDIFTGAMLQPVPADGGFTLDAASIFERFPVALLIPADAAFPARPALPPLP
jgi:(1->4)-alpha-D-glucan 1-alpha-D-glucosylmutase